MHIERTVCLEKDFIIYSNWISEFSFDKLIKSWFPIKKWAKFNECDAHTLVYLIFYLKDSLNVFSCRMNWIYCYPAMPFIKFIKCVHHYRYWQQPRKQKWTTIKKTHQHTCVHFNLLNIPWFLFFFDSILIGLIYLIYFFKIISY